MKAFDLLVLSPHLDDAALSCGGQIANLTRAGKRVCIVTLFAGHEPGTLSDLAKEVHGYFDIAQGVVAQRREEDIAAAAVLRAEIHHGDIGEAIYRSRSDGSPLYPDLAALFEAPDSADTAISGTRDLLAALPAAIEVLAPLAVGGHVDHQLVKVAAGELYGERVSFYEDFPYVQKWLALRRTIGFRSGMREEIVPLEEIDIADRIRAIAAYRSQVKALFGDEDRIGAEVRKQIAGNAGERRWRAKAKPTRRED